MRPHHPAPRLLLGLLLPFLLLAALPRAALAAADVPCPQFFLGGTPPALLNPKMERRTHLLCFQAFAVLDSGLTRTPLWSAEHLTRAALAEARTQPRNDAFHAEPRLPPEDRADLADYARSGYDRGHMSPSGDMPDAEAQAESFSLANMVPQAPELNRGLWEGIESAVRTLARKEGQLYVVTGPIFQGREVAALKGGLLVPTAVFKAIYDPRRRQAGAYVAQNTNGGDWRPVSIADLRDLAGMDVFPALPADVAAQAMRLPAPTPHYGRSRVAEAERRHRRSR